MSTVASPAIVRIMRRIHISADGCWEYQGAKSSAGYGQIGVRSDDPNGPRMDSVHRVAYRHYVGPIPEGLVIDHLCRNRACCNPRHLEAVTQRENTIRGIGPSARNIHVTHCPKGHPYSGENLYIAPATGARACKACRHAAVTRYNQRVSAELRAARAGQDGGQR